MVEQNSKALHFNISIVSDVDKICEPILDIFKIVLFEHVNINPNGSLFRIANNAKWTGKYFTDSLYNDKSVYNITQAPKEGRRRIILAGIPSTFLEKSLYENNLWNCLLVYEKNEGVSANLWFFGAFRENIEVLNYYSNYPGIFDNFINYFKEKGEYLLNEKKYESNLIRTDNNLLKPLYEKNIGYSDFLIKNLRSNEIPFLLNDKEIFFTQREIQTLALCMRGRTAKETGKLLKISESTVEVYLSSIRRKTGLNKNKIVENFSLYKNLLDLSLPTDISLQ